MTAAPVISIAKPHGDLCGLRNALHFPAKDADRWMAWVRYGRRVRYDDFRLMDLLETFAQCVREGRPMVLSKGTEARITRLVASPLPVGEALR